MSTRERIHQFFFDIQIYVISVAKRSDIEFMLRQFDKFLPTQPKTRIYFALHEEGNEREANKLLLQTLSFAGVDAFRDFANFVLFYSPFAGVKKYVKALIQNLSLVEVLRQDRKTSSNIGDGLRYGHTGLFNMIDSFNKIIVGKSDEGSKNFKQACVKLLEDGFHFKFVVFNAIIDDLICDKTHKVVALKEAKIAIHNLLPYAVNLCRYPNRKEYKVVKKYTAHYLARIKNNLRSSPNMPDSILESLGYKQSEFADEVVLNKPSKSILEIAFEIYLCELQLEKIVAMVEKLTDDYNITVTETLVAWLEVAQQQAGKVAAQDIIRHLMKSTRISRLPLAGTDDMNKKKETASRADPMIKVERKVKREVDQFNKEESDHWMYHDDDDVDKISSQPKQKRPVVEDNVLSNLDKLKLERKEKSERSDVLFDSALTSVQNNLYGSVLPMKSSTWAPSLDDSYRSLDKTRSKLDGQRDQENYNPSSLVSNYAYDVGHMLTTSYKPKYPLSTEYIKDKDAIIYMPPNDDNGIKEVRIESKESSLVNLKSEDPSTFFKPTADIATQLSNIGDSIYTNNWQAIEADLKRQPKNTAAPDESVYENFTTNLSFKRSLDPIDRNAEMGLPTIYSDNTKTSQQDRHLDDEMKGSEFAAKGMPKIYQRE